MVIHLAVVGRWTVVGCCDSHRPRAARPVGRWSASRGSRATGTAGRGMGQAMRPLARGVAGRCRAVGRRVPRVGGPRGAASGPGVLYEYVAYSPFALVACYVLAPSPTPPRPSGRTYTLAWRGYSVSELSLGDYIRYCSPVYGTSVPHVRVAASLLCHEGVSLCCRASLFSTR